MEKTKLKKRLFSLLSVRTHFAISFIIGIAISCTFFNRILENYYVNRSTLFQIIFIVFLVFVSSIIVNHFLIPILLQQKNRKLILFSSVVGVIWLIIQAGGFASGSVKTPEPIFVQQHTIEFRENGDRNLKSQGGEVWIRAVEIKDQKGKRSIIPIQKTGNWTNDGQYWFTTGLNSASMLYKFETYDENTQIIIITLSSPKGGVIDLWIDNSNQKLDLYDGNTSESILEETVNFRSQYLKWMIFLWIFESIFFATICFLFLKMSSFNPQILIRFRVCKLLFCIIQELINSLQKTNLFKFMASKVDQLESLLFSLLLIVIVFFNVIFQGSTMTFNNGLFPVDGYRSDPKIAWNPLLPYFGYDPYGPGWQSEPSIFFMRYLIDKGESPYWDPYPAGGIQGISDIYSNMFSPFNLMVVLLKPNAITYNFTFIFLNLLALYFLHRILRYYLGFSRLSSAAASIVYLINGFCVLYPTTNVSQSWLYVPILLYAFFSYTVKPNVANFLLMVCANFIMLTVTFLPPTIMLIGCVYVISFAFIIQKNKCTKQRLFLFSSLLASGLFAFGLLSFIYFPTFEILQFPHAIDAYTTRSMEFRNFKSFLDLFSGRSFDDSVANRDTMGYIGIVPAFILIQTWGCKDNYKKPIVWALTLLIAIGLGRLYGFPIISPLWGVTPFIKTFSINYIWIIPTLSSVFLVAFGFEALAQGSFLRCFITALLYFCLVYWFYLYGIGRSINLFYGTALYTLLIVPIIFFILVVGDKSREKVYRFLLVLIILGELSLYMNNSRFISSPGPAKQSPLVSFVKETIGLNRVANCGWNAWTSVMTFANSAFQIQTIECNVRFGLLPWYHDFFNSYLGGDTPTPMALALGVGNGRIVNNIYQQAINLAGVKYIIVNREFNENCTRAYVNPFTYKKVYEDKQALVWENPNYLEKVFISPALDRGIFNPNDSSPKKIVLSDDEELLTLASQGNINKIPPDFDVEKEYKASILEYHNTDVRVKAELKASGILVMMDNWNPDWKVNINGTEGYLGRVFGAFRGIVLSPGIYIIEYKYVPASMPYIYFVTILILTILMIMIIFHSKINKWIKKGGRILELP